MKKYAALAATASFSAAALVGCGGGDDFCDATTEDDVAMISGADPNDPNSLTEAADRLDELAGEAPDEIKSDLETARDAFRQMAEANGDPEALGQIDTASFMEAGQNLQQWEQNNC